MKINRKNQKLKKKILHIIFNLKTLQVIGICSLKRVNKEGNLSFIHRQI